MISIHALLAESDHRSCTFAAPLLRFLSTLSLRRATPVCQWRRSLKIFLSTLSLRRATVFVCVICQRLAISIHALLAESDNQQGVENMRLSNISIHALLAESDAAYVAKTGMTEISIHALLAESDQLRFLHNLFAVLFLSTLSLRRATTLRREPRS